VAQLHREEGISVLGGVPELWGCGTEGCGQWARWNTSKDGDPSTLSNAMILRQCGVCFICMDLPCNGGEAKPVVFSLCVTGAANRNLSKETNKKNMTYSSLEQRAGNAQGLSQCS